MSRQYDSQLIESVAVRRRRLREAWLFGSARSRNTLDEGVTKLFASAAVAAVVCAGCVGYSFIQDSRGKENGPVAPSPGTSASPTAPVSSGPSSGVPSTPVVPPTPPRS